MLHQIDGRAGIVHVEHTFPGVAAIGGAVNAARGIGCEEGAGGGGKHAVAVGIVNHHATKVGRLFKPLVLPRGAAVCRFINPVADETEARRVGLAGAGPHHLRVGGIDGQGSHGDNRGVGKHVLPRGTIVGSFVDATGSGSHVEDGVVERIDGNVGDASADVFGAGRCPRGPFGCGGLLQRSGLTKGHQIVLVVELPLRIELLLANPIVGVHLGLFCLRQLRDGAGQTALGDRAGNPHHENSQQSEAGQRNKQVDFPHGGYV